MAFLWLWRTCELGVSADIVRLQDGILVEHWDVFRRGHAGTVKSGLPMFGANFRTEPGCYRPDVCRETDKWKNESSASAKGGERTLNCRARNTATWRGTGEDSRASCGICHSDVIKKEALSRHYYPRVPGHEVAGGSTTGRGREGNAKASGLESAGTWARRTCLACRRGDLGTAQT